MWYTEYVVWKHKLKRRITMKKRVFACLLALVMLLGMVAVPSFVRAEEEDPPRKS